MAESEGANFIIGKENARNFMKKLQNDMSLFSKVNREKDNYSEKYIKLVSGLRYWNKIFKTAYTKNRLIFTLYNEHEEFKMDTTELILELIKLYGQDAIVGLFFPRNRRYIGIDFNSEETKKKVQKEFVLYKGFYVVPAEVGEIAKYLELRVHWAPIMEDFDEETRRSKHDNKDIWKSLMSSYVVYENVNIARRSGMALIVDKTVVNDTLTVESIGERIMLLKVNFCMVQIVVVNVHMPSDQYQKKVNWITIQHIVRNNVGAFVIIAGDLNINNKTAEKKAIMFLDNNLMIDVGIYTKVAMVPTRIDKRSANRLDRFYVTPINGYLYELKYFAMPFSDHLVILMEVLYVPFEMESYNRIGLIPKCDNQMVSVIKNNMDIKKILKNDNINALLKWQLVKDVIYKEGVENDRKNAKAIQVEIDNIKSLIAVQLESDQINTNIVYDLRARLEYLLGVQQKNLMLKLGNRIVTTATMPNWILVKILKKKKSKANIKCVIENDKVITSNLQIVTLLQNNFIRQNKNKFMDKADIKKFELMGKSKKFKFYKTKNIIELSDEEQQLLNSSITENELKIALSKSKNKSSPGPDGLTSQIYLHFDKDLMKGLLDYYNMLMDSEDLNSEHTQLFNSYIKIIPKKYIRGDWAIDAEQYRPIALTNVDQKVLERIILDRIVEIVKRALPDTVYGVKGRTIGQAILALHMAFSNSEARAKERLYVLRIDMQGAFNNVNGVYLNYLIKKYIGVSKTTLLLMKIIKNKKIAFVNQKIYDKFDSMQNGILQGSPLSSLLYSLYLVELINEIESISRGIWIKGRVKKLKVVSYIDDLTIFISDKRQLDKIYNVLKTFMDVTGSAINFDKSYLWSIKENKQVHYKDLNGTHGKILGIKFPIRYSNSLQYTVLRKKLEEIEIDVKMYYNYNIGWLDKIKLINTLVVSRFCFYMPYVNISNQFANEFSKIVQKFLFRTYSYIGKYRVKLPPKKGGLGLLDIKVLNKSVMYNYIVKNVLEDGAYNRLFQMDSLLKDPLMKMWKKVYIDIKNRNFEEGVLRYKQLKLDIIVHEQAYLRYRGGHTNVKYILSKYTYGNYQNFLIKHALGILPTKQRLQKIGIIRESESILCVFNCGQIEDQNHIFVNCTKMSEVKRMAIGGIQMRINCTNWMRSKKFLDIPDSAFRPITVFCFAIWKYRCDIVFKAAKVEESNAEIMKYYKLLYVKEMFMFSAQVFQKMWGEQKCAILQDL